MTITTTAIGFSLSSIGLAFCGIHFFSAFRKIGGLRAGSRIGILLSALHFGFVLVNGTMAIGTLFFATNPQMLYVFLLVANFFLMITAVLGMYLVFYILFPLISPWPGMILAFTLGTALILITIRTHPHPFIDASGGIDLNFSRGLSILLSYLLFIGIGSFFAIFSHSFVRAKSREVRIASFILAALAIIGIMNIFIRFLLPVGIAPDPLRTRVFDMTQTFIGVIFISVFVLPPIILGWLSKTKNHQ
ncbi:MAG: hypothetical protein G01um101433_86 [Parcubacteria group bacterium Gr01-1014_33]|nr:MAG: hypothetical protein G01um101433_86 [Parcubacteria group bacterium Gr01-1014_33]